MHPAGAQGGRHEGLHDPEGLVDRHRLLMLRVVVGDVPHLERVISRLRGLAPVQQTETPMLLSALVRRPSMPRSAP